MASSTSGVRRLEVVARRPASASVVEFTLARPDRGRLPDWAPGAHIDVELPGGCLRQYSLCGDRWDAHHYRIAVQREDDGRGGSKLLIDEVRVGDELGFGGPRNNFRMAPAAEYLFVAGGIGITPVLPMIAQAELLDIPWRLLYLGRSRDRLAGLDELAAYADRVAVHCSAEHGRLRLDDWRPATAGTRVYACGPRPLIDAVEAWGAAPGGHPPSVERFSARSTTAATHSFEVIARRSGVAARVAGAESIVDALRRVDVEIITSCGEGLCGTCETDVLDGSPVHRDAILTDAERADGRFLMPCVSRCAGERLVLDV